ncbi:MAG: DUF2169 domain-containing protein [Sandaracinaceae bacterium]
MLPIPWREPDTVPLINTTPFHAFPISWQLRPPQDATIMVVKATFDLVQGGAAVPAEEQILPTGEEPFDDALSPECLRYPGDTALFKPRADVFLVGRAFPRTDGRPVTLVRFAVGSAVEASVAVLGDRQWVRGVPSAQSTFESMPLRPDLAFGGAEFEGNPVGRGHGSIEGGRLPNLEHPERLLRHMSDTPPPVFTTPIPASWKPRARYRGTYGAAWLERAPYFPEDFDWRFFNAAPETLQAPYLRGDEPYWIQGMDPTGKLLEGTLPGVAPRVFALPAERPNVLHELPMNLDTVFFDAEAKQVVLVWRGAIDTSDQFGSDLGAFFVRADPIAQPAGPQAVQQAYVEAYRKKYEEDEDEEDEVEEVPEPRAPDRPPPVGLTPEMARKLGLPPSAATVHVDDEEAAEPPPPPPPEPALARPEVEALLRSGEPIDDVDLSGCDLSQIDLRGRSLTRCVMSGVDLTGAQVAGMVLSGSILTEAKAQGVDFAGAQLQQVDLGQAVLTDANFEGANLEEADLSGASCERCNFTSANLARVVATEADFSGARFDGANADEADLTGARLLGASLSGLEACDLRLYDVDGVGLIADDAKLPRLRADNASFSSASFQRVEAPDSSIRQADLSRADFRKSTLDESVFEDSNLEGAFFSQVEAKECRWPRVNAAGASFLKANLQEGYFEAATFEGADLRGANLYNADTFRSSFLGADLRGAIVGNSGLE